MVTEETPPPNNVHVIFWAAATAWSATITGMAAFGAIAASLEYGWGVFLQLAPVWGGPGLLLAACTIAVRAAWNAYQGGGEVLGLITGLFVGLASTGLGLTFAELNTWILLLVWVGTPIGLLCAFLSAHSIVLRRRGRAAAP